MWIAREENGDLYLFRHKPYKFQRYWYCDEEDVNKGRLRIDRDLLLEVDFYNSPIEVDLYIDANKLCLNDNEFCPL